jgi:hypothetical protein
VDRATLVPGLRFSRRPRRQTNCDAPSFRLNTARRHRGWLQGDVDSDLAPSISHGGGLSRTLDALKPDGDRAVVIDEVAPPFLVDRQLDLNRHFVARASFERRAWLPLLNNESSRLRYFSHGLTRSDLRGVKAGVANPLRIESGATAASENGCIGLRLVHSRPAMNVLDPIFAGSADGDGEELNAIEPCDVFWVAVPTNRIFDPNPIIPCDP